MSTPKWAPGPYKIEPYVDAIHILDANGMKVADVADRPIGPTGEPPQNANLLAAAPELYAEVELLRHIAMSMPDPKLGEWDWPNILVRTSLLLAKARGEATPS